MWFIGVGVEQETSAPPPTKNPASAPDYAFLVHFVDVHCMHDYNVKPANVTFYGGGEHTTTNFSFSV